MLSAIAGFIMGFICTYIGYRTAEYHYEKLLQKKLEEIEKLEELVNEKTK